MSVPYSLILRGACVNAGFSYDNLDTKSKAVLQQGISNALLQATNAADWPETRRNERRRLRLPWLVGTTYAAAAEVLHVRTGKYVQALRASTGEEPYDSSNVLNTAYWAESKTSYSADDWTSSTTLATVGTILRYPVDDRYYALHTAASTGTLPTDTTKFGILTDFDPYIAYTQSGQTVINTCYRVTDRDPNKTTQARNLYFRPSRNGIQIIDATLPTAVWLEFRAGATPLTGALYSASATYTSGGQVYFESTANGVTAGDFYTANTTATAGESPSSAPTKWDVVSLPGRFELFLQHAGAAFWLLSQGEARAGEAAREVALANAALAAEFQTLEVQSQQNFRIQRAA